MVASSRFAIAVHVLSLLADAEGEPVKSEYAAGSVSTNPVVVRRVLRACAAAGLVKSQSGGTGGSRLARPAEEITLRDIYRAVEHGDLFAVHRHPPNARCPIGRHIRKVLGDALDRAQAAAEGELAGTTLAQVLTSLRNESARAGATP